MKLTSWFVIEPQNMNGITGIAFPLFGHNWTADANDRCLIAEYSLVQVALATVWFEEVPKS